MSGPLPEATLIGGPNGSARAATRFRVLPAWTPLVTHAQVRQGLTLLSVLSWNSGQSSCLSLPRAGTANPTSFVGILHSGCLGRPSLCSDPDLGSARHLTPFMFARRFLFLKTSHPKPLCFNNLEMKIGVQTEGLG